MKKIFLYSLIVLLYNLTFSQNFNTQAHLVILNGEMCLLQEGKYFTLDKQVVTVKLKDYKRIPTNINVIRQNLLGYYDIKVPDNISYKTYMNYLNSLQIFSVIEYNGIGKYEVGNKTNDTEFGKQWYLSRIRTLEAWNISFGEESIKVGVLDSGVDWTHNDIGLGKDSYQNIYSNPKEDVWRDRNNPSSGDKLDNDNNGFIDDLKGWNFVNQNNDVRTTNKHGTMVTGIISAKTNNVEGIAGIVGGKNKKGVQIIPICVGINNPESSILDDAIIYAVNSGVKIIQLSLNVLKTDAIEKAIEYAKQKDVLIICASGNASSNNIGYPSSNQYVIAVGGTDKNNKRASFANYGNNLSVVAPAIDIISTGLNNSYTSDDGTSFAAPQVSAIAALILSANPNLTGKEVRDIIEKTAQKVGGYNYQNHGNRPNGTWNNEMGYGLVDAYKAVQYATIGGVDSSCPNVHNTFELKVGLPVGATIKWESPQGMQTISGQGTKKCTLNALSAGNYLIKVIVTHNGTHKTYEKELKVFQPYSMPPPTIKNHPNTPSSIPCCGGSNYIKHVICTSSGELEWQNTITYKDPKDYVTFIVKSNEVEMQVTRFTSTPLIVSTKAREVASKGNPCSKTSDWSETISRYYGSVRHKSFGFYPNKTTSKKRAITEKNYFIDEYFLSKDLLNIEVTDIYEWLDMTYSNKNLTENDVEKIMYIINNEDLLKQLNIKIFNLDGKLIFNKDYNSENIIEINVSHLQKGNYVIYYSCGSLSHGKVIYKPL